MTRRQILERSLEKKQGAFNAKLTEHFDDVKGAQGEPMRGHRRGDQVLRRWEKQNDSLKRLNAEIEKTKAALEREDRRDSRNSHAVDVLGDMPPPIARLVQDGTLIQWKKYPDTFFVDGVDKARIQFKKGVLWNKYASALQNGTDERKKFVAVFNALLAELREGGFVKSA